MTNTTRAALVFWLTAEAPSQEDMTVLFEAVRADDIAAIRALVVANNGPTNDERWAEAMANV